MNQDIDRAIEGWDYKPGTVQARLVKAQDGRQILQLRVDLGILQMETAGRPDGSRPHGFATYFEYLQHQARIADHAGQGFTPSEEQCEEADREFFQFYYRRICWLTLHNYGNAVADANHTLAFMDFVREHSPSEEYTQAHEQFRGLVLFHRTHAAAAVAMEKNDAEAAIDTIRDGLDQLRDFFAAHDAEEQMEENGMVQQLRKMERSLRKRHRIEATLQEKLDEAVAKEQYEDAARLRDELRRKRQ
jgi:hypothetical protein